MSSLNDLFFQTHQEWQTDGPPKSTMVGTGPLFRTVSKGPRTDWAGGTVSGGSVKGLVPVRSKRNGNQGPAYSKVYTNATGYGGERFEQDLSEQWEILRVRAKFLEVLKNPAAMESGMSGLMDDMEQAVMGWGTSMSQVLWQDGKGAFGCGDGAYSVAGDTIQLLNYNSARCFEVGDVLRLIPRATYDAAVRGARPAARTGTITVASVNEKTGEITVEEADISVAIAGAANTDVISKDSYYPDTAEDTDTGPNMAGVYTWLARTETEAVQTVYGVDCGTYPTRLAGRRIELTGAESPYEILSLVMEEAVVAGARPDMVSVPSGQVSKLIQELAARNMLVKDVKIGAEQPQNMTYGVTASGVQWGEIRAAIVSDQWQINHFVTKDNDISYTALQMSDFGLTTTSSGISWKDWDGDGTYLVQKGGTQGLEAAYGSYAAFRCEDTGHQIYAGVGTNA